MDGPEMGTIKHLPHQSGGYGYPQGEDYYFKSVFYNILKHAACVTFVACVYLSCFLFFFIYFTKFDIKRRRWTSIR